MIRQRVNAVIGDWCGGLQPDQTTALSDQWTETRNSAARPHDGIDYQPDGVNLLLEKLRAEFSKPGDERKDTSVLEASDFKPNGNIDTIDNLVDAVVACPNLPSSVEPA
jgi:hypothetical protein